MDPATGTVTILTHEDISYFDWSPDGKTIIAIRRTPENDTILSGQIVRVPVTAR